MPGSQAVAPGICFRGCSSVSTAAMRSMVKPLSPSARKNRPRSYAYYRCFGTDAYRFDGDRICPNTQVRTDRLELAVWHEVSALLAQPERLRQEI